MAFCLSLRAKEEKVDKETGLRKLNCQQKLLITVQHDLSRKIQTSSTAVVFEACEGKRALKPGPQNQQKDVKCLLPGRVVIKGHNP